MTVTRRAATIGGLSLIGAAWGGPVRAEVGEWVGGRAEGLTPAEARTIALEAYLYGYSLVTTEVTRVQMTNVAKIEGMHMPMGQFLNVERYPPAEFRGVSAPNADTLYSIAWLDLGKEPAVFSHPDMKGRYFLFPMYSLWMPVIASPGTRTTGEKARTFLISGPGWSGEVPAGMTQIKSPTRYLVILGRTYADGTAADYDAVHALQARYDLRPLSAYGREYTYKAPPVDPNPGFSLTDKPQKVILDMGMAGYLAMMARLMGEAAPPGPEDAPILARMAQIGLVPGQPFTLDRLPAEVRAALEDVPRLALEAIGESKNRMGELVDGWVVTKGLGRYGTDYTKRAVVAAFGWPANLEQDAVYPYTEIDGTGMPLSGGHNYTLTFAKDRTPPVNGFWSITMYEIDQGWWFVPNRLDKFTVSPRDDLKYNEDGSLTLYLQHESPGAAKEANWLPAPKGAFIPMLRMYWPKDTDPSILDGSWKVPQLVKAS